ncbi:hypothetical protein ABT224_30955 [Streptomyces sp. NPDC001584]|uniref:hypothetical protein n=1 Tax=Streptomyces sp. NPDC001584 TaxID=3154521 RepID=UPI00332D9E06
MAFLTTSHGVAGAGCAAGATPAALPSLVRHELGRHLSGDEDPYRAAVQDSTRR